MSAHIQGDLWGPPLVDEEKADASTDSYCTAFIVHVFDDDVRAEIHQHPSSRVLVDALAEHRPDLLESLAQDLLDFEAPALARFRELDAVMWWARSQGAGPLDDYAAACRELADEVHNALHARGWTWGHPISGQSPGLSAAGGTDAEQETAGEAEEASPDARAQALRTAESRRGQPVRQEEELLRRPRGVGLRGHPQALEVKGETAL